MKLLVIAYPRLSSLDFQRIESCRINHDPLSSIVRPHFTFIFPSDNITSEEFSAHVMDRLNGMKDISFSLDRATVHDDSGKEFYYVFLIPGTGFAEMSAMYDHLNKNLPGSREAIPGPFLPHITIGRSADKSECEQIAANWNASKEIIHGIIDSLDIISFENQKVATLQKIQLPGH